jgi:hypothetical protein
MAGITNRGKRRLLEWPFNALALPTSFYAILASAFASAQDTSVISSCTIVPDNDNGYTHTALSKNTTDFPGITQDDTGDKATIRIKNLSWTASGGDMPSGAGATYLILTTGTAGTDDVIAFWSLTSARQVSTGQSLQVNNAELDLTE